MNEKNMSAEEFRSTLKEDKPPAGISGCLQALWYDGKNDWERAHTIAQDIETKDGARVHAYLHRKEGDSGNANYWYVRAGKTMPGYSLEKEWEEMVKSLMASSAK
ncbi:MAG TPA: hypothetical protein VF939_09775 [Puia sp.]